MTNGAWHPDPTGRHQLRYHDGDNWTDHISNNGATGTDPLDQAPAAEKSPSKTGAFLKKGLVGLATTGKTPKGSFAGVTIKDGQITSKQGGGPVTGAHATVETAGDIQARFTATRLLALGPLGLAFKKKKDKRELFLTIEGQGYAIVVEVDPNKGLEARQFAALINGQASGG